VAQLYPQALSPLFVASYDSQGYGGGIRTRIHAGPHPLTQLNCQFKVKVTLQLTVSQSVTLGVEPHLGLMTRYLLLFDSYGLVLWGALSDERTGLSFMYAAGPRQRTSNHPPYTRHGPRSTENTAALLL
jgi:hypothetical protein